MDNTKNKTLNRFSQVTQRLDHMVPEARQSDAQNAEAAAELAALSEKLAVLLPDSSLSPDERLERLARVVQDRVPYYEHLLPAASKVAKLKSRINELVPGEMSSVDKISQLADMAIGQCGADDVSCVDALEMLGDPRAGIGAVK